MLIAVDLGRPSRNLHPGPPFDSVPVLLHWLRMANEVECAPAMQVIESVVLTPEERAYVKLRYLGDLTTMDVVRVVPAMALPPGIHTPFAAEKIVLLFCGRKVGDAALKRDLRGAPEEEIERLKQAGFARLRELHASTIIKLTSAFVERGLVLIPIARM